MGAYELMLVLGSAALHAGWNMVVKSSQRPVAFMAWLGLAYVPLTLLCWPWLGVSDYPAGLTWVFAISVVVHAGTFTALSHGYEAGDLSLVYPIARSAPALLPVVAVLWLGETLTPWGALGIAAVLAGMWLVQTNGKLSWAQLGEPAALFAYTALLLMVGYSITDKLIMAALHEASWSSPMPRALSFYLLFSSATALLFAPVALRSVGTRGMLESLRRDTWPVLGGALATLAGYVMVLEALRSAQVSYVVAVRQISVVAAVGLAVVFLGERPGRVRLLGASMSVVGVVAIALFG